MVLGGALGEDAAVLDVGAPELLVVKTDPITLASADAARYLLAVNANDLVVTGAEPRWLLVTVLLPEGCSETEAEALLEGVGEACDQARIALVGGHTEVTVGLDRPVLVGCLLGTAPRHRVFRTAGARVGDAILVTGGVAIEGTAILAREHSERLRAAGVAPEVVSRAASWLEQPGISVLQAARELWSVSGLHTLHDVTEGGLATALHELAEAARVGLRIYRRRIPVLPECARIAEALGLEPLGLLGSGAMLASMDPAAVPEALERLRQRGILAAVIGEVRPEAEGRYLVLEDGREAPLPQFARDELARFLESA